MKRNYEYTDKLFNILTTQPLNDTNAKVEDHMLLIFVAKIPNLPCSLPTSRFILQNEYARAQRFVFNEDKLRYLYARMILRYVLNKNLQIEPKFIQFQNNQYGKPYLPLEINQNDIQFNLSHASDYVTVVITKGHQVGIDVEEINQNIDFLKIAKRFYHPYEYKMLINTKKGLQNKIFFRTWTCKEAFVKSIGSGLSYGFEKFHIDFASSGTNMISSVHDATSKFNDWSILSFLLDENKFVAVAIDKVISTQDIKLIHFTDLSILE